MCDELLSNLFLQKRKKLLLIPLADKLKISYKIKEVSYGRASHNLHCSIGWVSIRL